MPETSIQEFREGHFIVVGPYFPETAARVKRLIDAALLEDRIETQSRRTDVDRAMDAAGEI